MTPDGGRRPAPARASALPPALGVFRVLAIASLAAAVVVVAVAPRLVGAHGWTGVAQAVALRGPVGAAAAVGALALLALPWRRRLVVPVAVLAGIAVLHAVVLLGRGLDPTAGAGVGARPPGALVVLVSNTLDAVPAADLAALVAARGAHVVVLPETSAATADAVVRALAEQGRPMTALVRAAGDGATQSTALLVDASLGEYRVVAEVPGLLGSFTAAPVDGGAGPPVTAVHAYSPLPGAMGTWREETVAAVAACGATPGAVVAGDLNATTDHPAFDRLAPCVDAAVEAGAAGVGTWPAHLPAWAGAPIDHVLVDGRAWSVAGVTVLPAPPGSDHRAVEAVLVPVG